MQIPITHKKGHLSIDSESNKSYDFRLSLRDLEHFDADSLNSHYSGVAESLMNMKGDFLKLYFKGGDVYANTDDKNFSLYDTKVSPHDNLFDELLGKGMGECRILNQGDHLKVGGKYLRFFRLKHFPPQIADQGHFNRVGDYFMTIRKVPQSKSCSMLDRKRKVFRSENTGDFANYKSEEGEDQAEQLYAQIQLGEEALFDVEFWFWVLCDTEEELAEQTDKMLDVFNQHEGKIAIEDMGLSEAFLNFCPGVAPSFLDPIYLPSSYLLGLMPLSQGAIHETGMLFHSTEKEKIYFDLFSGANFNAAVIGHSGSGKTFLSQKIVDYYLGKNIKAVIIDRGESFDRLVRYHNGTIFGDKVNPLAFKNPLFLAEFLAAFIPQEEFSHKNRCLLFKVLRDGLEEQKIKDLESLFKTIDKEIPDFSLYFEQHRQLFTDQPLKMHNITYVDTRQYPDEFLRPLFIFLTEYIKHLEGRKIFVFEESWHTLQHNISYIGEFFRTSRALGIGCIAITQLLDDLISNPLGKIIAENTCFKILFSAQQENDYLDEHDLEQVSQLQSKKGRYSEFYLKTINQRKTLRYYPTTLEYERFTSHHEDRKAIDKFITSFKDHFDYKTLIKRWTELKHGETDNYLYFS